MRKNFHSYSNILFVCFYEKKNHIYDVHAHFSTVLQNHSLDNKNNIKMWSIRNCCKKKLNDFYVHEKKMIPVNFFYKILFSNKITKVTENLFEFFNLRDSPVKKV